MPHEVTQARRHSSAIAVERAIDLLSVLAERGDAGVGELAQTLGLGGGATHRLLVALRLKGVVEQDPTTGRYSLAWF
jgi:IclR family transcriptional regulator, acetate operon repressor